MSEPLAVGFAGIGRMGLPMARNILRSGFPLLVWNRSAARCAELADEGAAVVPEPSSLGEADVVVTMLADGAAVWSVLVDGGVFKALRPDSVVLEMSTSGPTTVARLAAAAASNDALLLDAPVSGSVSVAEAAQLFAMVGGDRAAYERATPVLDAMTKGHLLLGRSGAGAAMKLALNGMIAATNESLAETLALAERFGINREHAYDVVAGGALASPFVQYKRAGFLEPDATPVAFTAALMLKDVMLAKELAGQLGARVPAAEAAGDVLEEAVAAGLGDADMAAVLQVLLRAENVAQASIRTDHSREEP